MARICAQPFPKTREEPGDGSPGSSTVLRSPGSKTPRSPLYVLPAKGRTTRAPAGGVNVNVDGRIASKLTEVKVTDTTALALPRGKIATASGTLRAPSTLISTLPMSVWSVRGCSTSAYASRPATRLDCPTETAVVGSIAFRASAASWLGSGTADAIPGTVVVVLAE